MDDQASKRVMSGWQPWVLGAALSIGCAAIIAFHVYRVASRSVDRTLEGWWQDRERLRANGNNRAPLFV